MLLWHFRAYVSASERNDTQKAIDGYDSYGRSAFSRAVQHLAITPKIEWNEPHGKKLKNEDPLYEIRYKANNRQERALGYFGPDGDTFVIVLICYHKGRVYTPADAFKSARRRMEQIAAGTASSVPLQVLGEDFPPDDDDHDGT